MIAALTLVPLILLAGQDDPTRPLTAERTARQPAGAPVTAAPSGSREGRRVRILDVSDLTGADRLGALRDAIGSELLDEEVRYAALERYLDIVESGEIQSRAESLVDAIETFADPRIEGSEFRIAVASPGELIVAADSSVHAWIDGFFASMRRFDGQIDIQIVTFQVPGGSAADVWGGRTAVTLDAAGTGALMERLMATDDAMRLQAPRLLTNAAQHASLFTGEQTAYIRDYEFTVLPDRAVEIADPVVDVISTGTSIDVLAIPISKTRLAIEIEFAQSTAERPFKELTTTLGTHGAPVTVQLPEVKTSKVDARFELDPGGSIALTVKDPAETSRDIVVIMRAERVMAERGPRGAVPGERRR